MYVSRWPVRCTIERVHQRLLVIIGNKNNNYCYDGSKQKNTIVIKLSLFFFSPFVNVRNKPTLATANHFDIINLLKLFFWKQKTKISKRSSPKEFWSHHAWIPRTARRNNHVPYQHKVIFENNFFFLHSFFIKNVFV